MRKYVGILLFFLLWLLVIPFIALPGQAPSLKQDMSSESNSPSKPPEDPLEQLAQTDPESYQENRFYLIQNHETGETMAMTPEDYIKGVVAAEMPVGFHPEALKAQAVAAHTYALRQIDSSLSEPDPLLNGAYLSTDPDHFQAYLSKEELQERWGKNFSANYQKLSDAVEEVIDVIMMAEDEPIIAAFHSISSGQTESAANVWGQEVSYLTPVKSEGDQLSPDYESQVVLSEAEVAYALKKAFPQIQLSEDRSRWIVLEDRSESGTVLACTAGDQPASGREIREALGLKSANFTVSFQDGAFTFQCIGYGHGVGMSQYGADYLARQGMTYDQILSHYYTGISFQNTRL